MVVKVINIFSLLFFVNLSLKSQTSPQPIGQWRQHLPFGSAIAVEGTNQKIFLASPYALTILNVNDQNTETFSHVNGLAETGISALGYDSLSNNLLIAYNNSNIDIISSNNIKNISDVKRSVVSGDKTINSVFAFNQKFYLSTGLGVIIVNPAKAEISDTWYLGINGNPQKVNSFFANDNFFYAATPIGLLRCNANNQNPANSANWQNLSGTNGLTLGEINFIFSINNKIFLAKNDSIFCLNNNLWQLFYTDGYSFIKVRSSQNSIMICEKKNSNPSRVIQINTNGLILNTIVKPSVISYPLDAINVHEKIYVADQYNSLSSWNNTSFTKQLVLNSPLAIGSGEILASGNKFMATAGAINSAWNYQYNGNGIFILQNNNWQNINRYNNTQLDTLLDFICVAKQNDESIWAGSFGGGLIHISSSNNIEIFKQNSLDAAIGDPQSFRVAGLQFDKDGNLWISNYGASRPLVLFKPNKQVIKFSTPFSLIENSMAQIVIDDNNFLWIQSPKGNGLICYNHGNSLENTNDDQWKLFTANASNGNLPSNNIQCLAKDKSNFIWVGTDNGVGVMQCDASLYLNGCNAIWPIVQSGNFAGYLFKGQQINAIAVDGANRKWVATNTGAYLINETGEKLIAQFTQENSGLLSNIVYKIAIDNFNGEVFFATQQGLCSYRAEATETLNTNQSVFIYPNPVPPNYNGAIAIKGVENNAVIKITELNGRVVFETRAFGGQAIWYGKNYKGQTVNSGAYLVLIEEENKMQKSAGKIFFISK